jgi:hypothetical protein
VYVLKPRVLELWKACRYGGLVDMQPWSRGGLKTWRYGGRGEYGGEIWRFGGCAGMEVEKVWR